MNIKTEAIAFVVRLLANETGLIRKPSDFEELLNTMFGGESFDRRMAREIETESKRAFEATKRVHTNFKFKKITKNF